MRRRDFLSGITSSVIAAAIANRARARPRGGRAPTAVGAQGFRFFDDFIGGSLNSNDWIPMSRDGDQSNSELQWYLPGNVSVSNSNLNILTKVQSINGRSYTSGMVQWGWYNFLYGTIEIRAKMSGGTGPWGGIWLLGSDCQISNPTSPDNIGTCNWPNPGSDEIDVVEIANSNYTQTRQNLIDSSGDNTNTINLGFDSSAAFHTYQLVWAPNSLIWKVDGTTTKSLARSPSSPMFLLLNNAVGGVGGTPNNSTLPVTMFVDYVKVT